VLPAVPVTPACHAFIGVLLHVPLVVLKLQDDSSVTGHPRNKRSFEEHTMHASARALFIHSFHHSLCSFINLSVCSFFHAFIRSSVSLESCPRVRYMQCMPALGPDHVVSHYP